jgi:hypothetical protein
MHTGTGARRRVRSAPAKLPRTVRILSYRPDDTRTPSPASSADTVCTEPYKGTVGLLEVQWRACQLWVGDPPVTALYVPPPSPSGTERYTVPRILPSQRIRVRFPQWESPWPLLSSIVGNGPGPDMALEPTALEPRAGALEPRAGALEPRAGALEPPTAALEPVAVWPRNRFNAAATWSCWSCWSWCACPCQRLRLTQSSAAAEAAAAAH